MQIPADLSLLSPVRAARIKAVFAKDVDLEILTDDCSRTVKAAIDEHLDAGRSVYSQDSSGRIAKLSRIPQ